MDAEKQKWVDRITALLAKTVDRGATPAEEKSAKEMAASLMAKYDIDMTDLMARDKKRLLEEVEAHDVDFFGRERPPVDWVIWAICKFTDTKAYWQSGKKVGYNTYVYIGFNSDTAIAKYLTEYINNQIIYGWQDYLRDNRPLVTRMGTNKAKRSYVIGFCNRIGERLMDMANMRADFVGVDRRNALVVRKTDVIDAKMEEMNLDLKTVNRNAGTVYRHPMSAGRADGDKLKLTKHAVEHEKTKELIND